MNTIQLNIGLKSNTDKKLIDKMYVNNTLKTINMEILSKRELAIILVNNYAGSPNCLFKQLRKIKVDYVKVERGFKTLYILRHKEFGRVEVTLK